MANSPDGGLITETNAQYYEGTQLFFETSTVYSVTSNLDTTLQDAINSPANYKMFISISGGTLPSDFSLLNDQVVGAINATTPLTFPAGLVPLGSGPETVFATGGSGGGCVIDMEIDLLGNMIVSVIAAGSGYVAGDILNFVPTWPLAPALGYDTNPLTAAELYAGSTYEILVPGSNIVSFPNAGIPGPFPPFTSIVLKLALTIDALWNNYGSYEYIKLNDIVNNFIVAYIGTGKLIPSAKRTDIIFHAKRGLQEFSYDTLKSVRSQELTLSPSATAIIPQDYVNYVRMSWVDGVGVKHIIYPTQLTSNPDQPLIQGGNGIPTQDNWGENLESMQSIINQRWNKNAAFNQNGQLTAQAYNANIYNWTWWEAAYGMRYGANTVLSNMNGWFTINDREGKFMFSSDLKDKLIILEYISDGLAYDMDSKVPKMAEEALYMHIAHAILSTRMNIPEYVVRRYKVARRAELRNAKIRLQNLKLDTFIQQMRGKSKWIKH
jgi:hypothetical protein